RVSSVAAHVPNVAALLATGIVIGYDPNGPVDQKLVEINTATITFPRFGVTGSIRPYDPAAHSNINANNDDPLGANVIPGLVVRGNGFSLGTVELAYGLPPAQMSNPLTQTGTPTDQKIRFGGILELDDIRIGVSGLTVTIGAGNPFGNFTGEVFIATAGARLFPGKAFS